MLYLNDVISQIDTAHICKAFHPNKNNIPFSAPHGTYCKIDHILEHSGRLNKYKKIAIILSILFDPYGLKLDINKYRKTESLQTYKT